MLHHNFTNNIQKSVQHPQQSNGDDSHGEGTEKTAALVSATAAEDDCALMEDLPETVANLLSSATSAVAQPPQSF